ncbi:hypothetical protein GCM10007047_06090 [Cerasicoccus arenae]|uniref:Uncharacterized protein n=2 Tax=Cerasicoccus arenae TaxID=424488 RepID=A0A8J3DHH9_9BACT|nr:hypothetical protein GCM10007047_06090 [Cerasicoccus arenae]
MGPDQRVSASAIFIRENGDPQISAIAADDPRRFWQGVWDSSSKGLNPGEATPNQSALGWVRDPNVEHLGWLVSGVETMQGDLSGTDFTPEPNGEAPTGFVRLVAGDSVGDTNITDFVYAPKVDVENGTSTTLGKYAYWISDESQKAPVNLVDGRYLGAATSLQEQEFRKEYSSSRYSLMAPEKVGLQVLNGLASYDLEQESLASALERISLFSDIVLADPQVDQWKTILPQYYHDLGIKTNMLQVDVSNGGLKKDLSLLFELSDEDFSNSPFAGNPRTDRSDNPPYDDVSVYRDEFTEGPVSYLYKYNIPEISNEAYLRGPSWDYLRDYYQLYKHYSVGESYRARPYRPNTVDHNNTGDSKLQGIKRTFVSMFETKGGNVGINNNTVSTKSKLGDEYLNGGQQVQIPRLTRHQVAPVVVRFYYIFSLAQVTPSEGLGKIARDDSGAPIKIEGNDWNYVIENFGQTTAMTMMVQPVAVLWNPYNVPIEFSGYKIALEKPEITFGLSWSEMSGGVAVDRGYEASLGNLLNDASPAKDSNGNTLGSFRDNLEFVIGNPPDGDEPIVLKPGELQLFSMQQADPIQVGDIIIHEETLFLEPGWSTTGGLVFYRALDSVHRSNVKVNGVNVPIVTDNIPIGSAVTIHDIYWGKPNAADNSGVFSFKWYDFLLDDSLLGFDSIEHGGDINTEDFLLRGQAGTYKRPSGLSPQGEFNSIRGQVISPIQVTGSFSKKYPFMALEIRLNPAYSTPSSSVDDGIPLEMLGSMNPFGLLGTTEHSGNTVPGRYQLFVHPLNGEPSLNFLKPELSVGTDANTLFGYSYSNSSVGGNPGSNTVVLQEVPTAPLWSLGSLQHANTSLSSYEPRNAIANSQASLFVANNDFDLSETWSEGSWSNHATIADVSFLSNHALFDTYFFSSLAPGPSETSVGDRIDGLAAAAIVDGKPSLPNKRFDYMGDSDMNALAEELKAEDGYLKTAANWSVEGGFNVNSTSVDAWKAFLASNLGRDFQYIDEEGLEQASTNGTLFSRFGIPNSTVRDENNPRDDWYAPHALTVNQISRLAEEIVEQVKERGPFLSLADFVNRRPGSLEEDHRKQGALAAAIEASGINDRIRSRGTDAYGDYVDSGLYQENTLDTTSAGAPGWLTQADVLTPLAPYLSARSDTFIIRAYGESGGGFDGVPSAGVWCEAIVQRLPDYIGPEDNDAWDEINGLSSTNQKFGRRFVVVGFHWLSEDEI